MPDKPDQHEQEQTVTPAAKPSQRERRDPRLQDRLKRPPDAQTRDAGGDN